MKLQSSLTVASNGRVVIPAPMRAELGVIDGGQLGARLVDGTLILEPIDAAIKRAQAMVARYVPPDAGLAQELIAERHASDE